MDPTISSVERHPVSVASLRYVSDETGVTPTEALRVVLGRTDAPGILLGRGLRARGESFEPFVLDEGKPLGIMRATQVRFAFGSIAPDPFLRRLNFNGEVAWFVEEFLQ